MTYVFIVYYIEGIVFGDLSLVVIALLEMVASTLLASGYKKISL